MKNFIQNVKKHKFIALGCLALIILFIVIEVISITSDKKDNSSSSSDSEKGKSRGYFEKTKYPVTVTEKDQKLYITLDGSASSKLKWRCENAETDKVKAENDGEESDGKLVSVISAVSTGYATVSYIRETELSGVKYDEVKIDINVFVYSDHDGKLYVKLSEIRENSASAGAAGSKTPYLLDGNRVVLPNGGDWTLSVSGNEKMYMIFPGDAEDGKKFFQVRRNNEINPFDDSSNGINKKTYLVLKSKDLGIEQKLKCELNDDKDIILVPVEG